MRSLIYVLLVILIITILFHLRWNKKEKERLLTERDKIMDEIKEKEHLRNFLKRRSKKWLHTLYTILFLSFIILAVVFSILFFSTIQFDGLLKGAGIIQMIILVVSVYVYRKPYEFTHIIANTEPFVKKVVYGDHINIDSEIELKYSRIKEIDERIKELDAKPLAYN